MSGMPAPAPAPGSTTTWWPACASLRTISGTSATRRSPGAVSVGTPIRKGGNRSRTCDRVSVGLVGLRATVHTKSAAADHHRAASSTLEIPGVFLRACVLARWRRRPVFRVQRHEKTHGPGRNTAVCSPSGGAGSGDRREQRRREIAQRAGSRLHLRCQRGGRRRAELPVGRGGRRGGPGAAERLWAGAGGGGGGRGAAERLARGPWREGGGRGRRRCDRRRGSGAGGGGRGVAPARHGGER